MSSGNYETQILDTIQMLVDNAINKADFDKTIQGTISRCVDPTIGKYIVRYQNSSFYAYSYNTDVIYPAKTSVYVLVPGNDMSKEKTIIGTVDKLGPDYVSIIEGENGYEVTGVNTINSDIAFELCSYKEKDIRILYDKENSINLINLDTFGFENYIKKSNAIICGATFKTTLEKEQQFRGDYGIAFSLDFMDNATGETVTKTFIVNVDQMKGNPYNYSTKSRQYGIFDVDGANFLAVNQIYIFEYDFPNTEENKPNDIFISDFELSAANALDATEAATCALTFITPQGTYFDDNDLDSDIRTLQAQIRIKGNAIDNNSQLVKYYWFIENNNITNKSEKYNQYGGAGWECLNEANIIQAATENTDAIVQWVSGTYEYKTEKRKNVAKETNYKCVAVYSNDTVLSRTITIYNYSSDFAIEIKSDEGTAFYYDLGSPTLTCYVNGEEALSEDYEYVWSEINNANQFALLNETTEENEEYNDAFDNYNNLMEQVKLEQVLTGQIQEDLDVYERVLAQYENVMRVEGNKIHNLKISAITTFSTYKCSVYKSGMFIGTASIIITNSLKNENAYTLVINNGNQVFKYNEQGIAPTNPALENPVTILPLSFTLYDNKGQKVNYNAIGGKNIFWSVPNRNSLINIPTSSGNPITSTETEDVYIEHEELNFDIDKKYDIKRDNNEIQLTVHYKDKVLSAKTNFTFTKEGEAGTNGTDFICKIIPNNTPDSLAPLYPTVTYNEYNKTYSLNYTPTEAEKWFKVQLWRDGERIYEGIESGETTEKEDITVQWSILKNNYEDDIEDNSNLSIDTDTGAIIFNPDVYEDAANIVKCVITYRGINYYAVMPVIVVNVENDDYTINLAERTGFRSVLYTTDGQTPSYDSTNPFEIIVTQNINGIKENVSQLELSEFAVDYDWNVCGTTYFKEWQLESNLIEKTLFASREKRNQKYYEPVDSYNGLCVNNAVLCTISRGGEYIGSIHIPIHFYLNRHGNAAMNGWDGNSISIDKDNSGVILAPQVGAGQKNEDNTFTGIFMGSVKEAGAEEIETGLFGYNSGERTIALSAYDGSAKFGKEGAGQIVIDPSTNEALLTSGNYDEEAGTGMEINLSEPSIKFGSGNFKVDKNGNVIAKGFATSQDVIDAKEEIQQEVSVLEDSIKFFNVSLDYSSLFFACDSNHYPINSSTMSVGYYGQYKGKDIDIQSVTMKNNSIDGINVSIEKDSIVFSVAPTTAIEDEINTFTFVFTYTGDNAEVYTEEKSIIVGLAIQGKDGTDGKDGTAGAKGEDGKSAYQLWLDAGNSGTEAEYLESLKGKDGADGSNGAAGSGVVSIEEQYYLSTSKTDAPAEDAIGWTETPPTWSSGKYIWTRSKITYENPTKIEYTTPVCSSEWEAINEIQIGGRNYILNSSGTEQKGFFKNFNSIDEDGYCMHRFVSKKTYVSIATPGYIFDCRDYEVGSQITLSYDIKYTEWNFPEGTNRQEFHMGQRYTSQSVSGGDTTGQWRSVTWHKMPEVGINGCVLNEWYHVEKTFTVPEPAAEGVSTHASIQLYNSNPDVEASVTFKIKNVKLEYGNKATDWTPAVEDTEDLVQDVQNYVDANVQNLQKQIDGSIQFWNGPEIPTLENYPANEWKEEDEKAAHQADIYTVIQDIDGELKQGKGYRFDKVNGTWTWVEITDNELSAVQALAESKAKVFITTPTPPYNIGDLWLKDGELYECITAKGSGGAFASSDWNKSLKYTDDTAANAVQSQLNNLSIGGRNILKGTNETDWIPVSCDRYRAKSAALPGNTLIEDLGLKAGDTITYSLFIKTSSGKKLRARIEWWNSENDRHSIYGENTIENGEGYSYVSGVIPEGYTHLALYVDANQTQNTITTGSTEYVRAEKFERGNKPTAWSPAPEDLINYTDETYNNIQIGGRNLLLDSTKEGTPDEYQIGSYIISTAPLTIGEKYTVSLNVTSTEERKGLAIYIGGSSYSPTGWNLLPITAGTHTYTGTFTLSSHADATKNRLNVYCSTTGNGQEAEEIAGTAQINWIKLEKGNKPTDWTPAPEDAIKTVDVEYYLSSSKTELKDGEWLTKAPEWTEGKYMWSRQVVYYNDGTSETRNETCIAGATGENGNGIESTTITYQESTSGTKTPTGTWLSTIPEVSLGNYLWTKTLIKYTDGTEKESYSVSYMGLDAENPQSEKSISGNNIVQIEDGKYVKSLTVHGETQQETSQKNKNLLDLTKMELIRSGSNTEETIEISKLSSNSFTYKNLTSLAAWTNVRFLLNDILENGKTYTFTVQVNTNSQMNAYGGYGTIGFNRALKGTTTIDLKNEIILTATGSMRVLTIDTIIDKDNYDYYLYFFPTQNSTQEEETTITYEKIGIFKDDVIKDIVMESGSLSYETGLPETSADRIRCNNYIDIEGYKYVMILRQLALETSKTIYFRYYDADYNFLQATSEDFKKSITIAPDATKGIKYLKFGVIDTDLTQNYNIVLRHTTNTAYEDFIPDSPSLDYPSELNSIETLYTRALSKNIINFAAPSSQVRFTWNEETQTLSYTGQELYYDSVSYNMLDIIKTIAGTGRSLVFQCENASTSNASAVCNVQLNISFSDGTATKYLNLYNINKKTQTKLTIGSVCKKATGAVLSVYTNNTNTGKYANTVTLTKPMLYIGEIADKPDYEVYKEEKSVIDLKNNIISEFNSKEDTLELVSGTLNKKTGYIKINGTESGWRKDTNAQYERYILAIDNSLSTAVRNPIISSHFNYVSSGHITGGAFIYMKQLFVYLPSEVTTVEEAKAWFAENQPEFIYELETPKTIQLDTNKIKLNEGFNNVFVNSSISHADFDLTYYTVFVGAEGQDGTNAKLVNISASSQMFKSNTGSTGTFYPDNITLAPTFQGVTGAAATWKYSIDGTTWTTITSGSHGITINSTTKNLTISKDSDLYTDENSVINFKCIADDGQTESTISIAKIFDVVDMNIGARNYALKTAVSAEATITSSPTYTNFYSLASSYSNFIGKYITISAEFKIEENDTKVGTFEFYGKNITEDGKENLQQIHSKKWNITELGTEFKKFSFTYNLTQALTYDVNQIGLRIDNFNGTIEMQKLKVELGNVATDWTMALEDLDNQEVLEYALTDTEVAPTTGWELHVLSVPNKYLWQRTKTMNNGVEVSVSNATCIYRPSKVLNSVTYLYYESTSQNPTDLPLENSSWTETKPVWTVEKEGNEETPKRYLWIKDKYSYSDGTTAIGEPYLDEAWEDYSSLDKALNDYKASMNETLTGGSVKIEGGEIIVYSGTDKNDSDRAIVINQKGIGFLIKGEDGKFPNTPTSVWGIDGEFDAKLLNIINLTADEIKDGKLTLGKPNLKTLAIYPTLTALKVAHPEGNIGDAYKIGTAEPYEIYSWDSGQKDWILREGGSLLVTDNYGEEIAKITQNGIEVLARDNSRVDIFAENDDKENNPDGYYGLCLRDVNKKVIAYTNTSLGTWNVKKQVVEESLSFGPVIQIVQIENKDSNGNIINKGIGFISIL